MDRVPGKKYEGNERIRRMNAIRGRLFYEAKGSYVCYLDGDDFYTDDRKLQKQADILDADTATNTWLWAQRLLLLAEHRRDEAD